MSHLPKPTCPHSPIPPSTHTHTKKSSSTNALKAIYHSSTCPLGNWRCLSSAVSKAVGLSRVRQCCRVHYGFKYHASKRKYISMGPCYGQKRLKITIIAERNYHSYNENCNIPIWCILLCQTALNTLSSSFLGGSPICTDGKAIGLGSAKERGRVCHIFECHASEHNI